MDRGGARTVWRAITQTEQIIHWWGAAGYAKITKLQPGANIQFSTGDGPIFPTIRVVNPPQDFVYEWPPHPRYFSLPFVTVDRLEEENGGTRVIFSESGFEGWPDDEARRARFERISHEFRMVLEGRSLPYLFDDPTQN